MYICSNFVLMSPHHLCLQGLVDQNLCMQCLYNDHTHLCISNGVFYLSIVNYWSLFGNCMYGDCHKINMFKWTHQSPHLPQPRSFFIEMLSMALFFCIVLQILGAEPLSMWLDQWNKSIISNWALHNTVHCRVYMIQDHASIRCVCV